MDYYGADKTGSDQTGSDHGSDHGLDHGPDHGSGARFSKLPVITGPVKLFCFPFQMGVSEGLKIVQ